MSVKFKCVKFEVDNMIVKVCSQNVGYKFMITLKLVSVGLSEYLHFFNEIEMDCREDVDHLRSCSNVLDR